MANNNISSPGVYFNETDQSFIPQGVIEAGAAVVGPTAKGPVERPTLVTSYNDYVAKFGDLVTSGSSVYSFFTTTAAYNYFDNGGETLLVTRVTSGSYTTARANTRSGKVLTTANALSSSITAGFNITGSPAATVTTGSSNRNITASITMGTNDDDISNITITSQVDHLSIGDVITFSSESLGATTGSGVDLSITLVDADFLNSFLVRTLAQGKDQNNSGSISANGSLENGTKDNIRIEIQNSTTSSGLFDLLVRRGDDITDSKVVLEQFNNLSLDPFDPGYVGKAIGTQTTSVSGDGTPSAELVVEGDFPNQSKYIFIPQDSIVDTPNYTDSEGNLRNSGLALEIPQNQSQSMGGALGEFAGSALFGKNITADNIQGVNQSDYTQSFYILNDPNYSYTSIAAPGLNYGDHSTSLNILLSNIKDRADSLAVIDLQKYSDNASITSAVNTAKTINNSYAATYFPWLMCNDPVTGRLTWAPPSTFIPGVYAYNDKVGEPWLAPAGFDRGALPKVIKTQKGLNKANRDALYEGKINPIAVFPRNGVAVFGQKTLQSQASALDRINVRRLLITVKQFLDQQAGNILFEQNTTATRNSFLGIVNPYLEGVQQKQGLYGFKVIMDESINTPSVIDRNELVGQIYLQPTKTAEFIILNFNIQPTGATFPESGGGSGTEGGY